MKIPEKFLQKYHLTGNSYTTANVNAALADLFTLLNKLNEEKNSLKAEIGRLNKEYDGRAAVQTAADTSEIEAMITRLEQKLDAVKSTVNDTLCIVNDAAISAKRAEEGALEAMKAAEEAKSISEKACTAAEKACVASENAALAAEKACLASENAALAAEKACVASENAALTAEKACVASENTSKAAHNSASSVGETVIAVGNEIIAKIAENNFSEPIAPIAIENIEEEQKDTVSDRYDEDFLVPVFKEDADDNADADGDDEDDDQDLDDGGFFSFVLEEDVVDLDKIEVIPVDNKADADDVEESDEAPEETEEIETEEEIEDEEVEEADEDDEEEQQFDAEESDDIAADLVHAAGLDGEVEQIEPAEDVSEEDLTAKLAEMYVSEEASEDAAESEEAPAEEEKPEGKPAPTSFNDMKSALNAIRARLKK